MGPCNDGDEKKKKTTARRGGFCSGLAFRMLGRTVARGNLVMRGSTGKVKEMIDSQ